MNEVINDYLKAELAWNNEDIDKTIDIFDKLSRYDSEAYIKYPKLCQDARKRLWLFSRGWDHISNYYFELYHPLHQYNHLIEFRFDNKLNKNDLNFFKENGYTAFINHLAGANDGDKDAQYELGKMYVNDDIDNELYNIEDAAKWFEKAAISGHIKSHSLIGEINIRRRTKDGSESKGFEWLHKGRELGDVESTYVLGSFIRNNQYDEKSAMKYIEEGANKGHIESQNLLAHIHFDKKRLDDGIKWYERAANQGSFKAQCQLGFLYLNGKLPSLSIKVEEDRELAFKWLALANEQGDIDIDIDDIGIVRQLDEEDEDIAF